MRFSTRTEWELEENALTAAVRARRSAGLEVVDLTVSNPTACGFAYDTGAVVGPLADAAGMFYEPAPFGTAAARAAVCGYYREAGAHVRTRQVCLTTSTSEGYSYLFRLLCDAGDEVLVATPSYPLFGFIAQLEGVRLREFPLRYEHGWEMDREALAAAMTGRTRAVIVVHPNNPTGQFVREEERRWLAALCAERGMALIVDEVFLDYPLEGVEARSFAAASAGERQALTFVLSGLSKVCALPGMKLSWVAAFGPENLLERALERLEVVADTFLSVGAPTQVALPAWLAGRGVIQRQIRERIAENLEVLEARLRGTMADRLALEGGWTAVLRVPRTVEGEGFAEAALRRGVLVQPGEFYGMDAGRVVVSLLTEPAVWRRGLALLPI